MFTDTVGYSASSQVDESGTLQRLREQEELVRPLLAEYDGREVKSTGDGFLVEFDSALKATQCAIEIQRRMHERNSQPKAVPLELRIGIHLGDIEEHGTDIFGDAVNIAARVEPLAAPGGVCISEQVFAQVHNKVPNALEKLPPQQLKNLRFPIGVYRVALPWLTRVTASPSSGPVRLAVLPFANISPDPKDEYFADGLTEELITVLSQLHELVVIARTSVIQYKSSNKPVSQIGSELGVAAVLEGSVRKAGDQLRITVQLIDASTEGHTWANSYDRKLDDVFAVQSDVARQIAEVLKLKMGKVEEQRLEERPTIDPESYLAYLKGETLLFKEWSEESFRAALKQFELAISLDPNNARAYAGIAAAHRYLGWGHYEPPGSQWDRLSRDYAARAIELDPNLAEAHCSLAMILWDDFDYRQAERELKLALSLNPSYSTAHRIYSSLLLDQSHIDEGLREIILAEETDPHSLNNLTSHLAVLIMRRSMDDAKAKLEQLRKADERGVEYYDWLAWFYLAQSDLVRAREAVDRLREISPDEAWWARVQFAAISGKKDEARALLKEWEKAPEKPSDLVEGLMHALLGDLDECFVFLNRAAENHLLAMQVWPQEPLFAPVANDPRFRVLLKRMKLA